MSSSRWFKRAALAVAAVVGIGLVPAVSPTASAQTDTGMGPGGEIFPVTPTRLLDTREPGLDVTPAGRKPGSSSGRSFQLDVTGVAGVPESGVLAVAVNVVTVLPSSFGYLSVRPAGFVPPAGAEDTVLMNFSGNDIVPNLGIVGVGENGNIEIDITTPAGNHNLDVVVDIFAWVATSGYDDSSDLGSRMVPVPPVRFLDTREPGGPTGLTNGRPLGPDGRLVMDIVGRNPVPNSSNITGVVLNVAGITPTASTYLTVTPERFTPSPSVAPTANGNYDPTQVKSNFVVAPVGSDGNIHLFNKNGSTHYTVDVVGYLIKGQSESTRAGRIVPLEQPFRSFDTRAAEFNSQRLGRQQWEDWSYQAFANSVELDGVEVGKQSGFIGNLSGFDTRRTNPSVAVDTFMTVNPKTTPDPTGEPNNANLNVREVSNQFLQSNMMLARYGSNGSGDNNMVSAFNANGSIHYTIDVYAVILDD